MARWSLREAQKKLPEIVEKAFREGPQTIALTRGRSVIITPRPKKPRFGKGKHPNMLEVLLQCPKGPDLKIERNRNDRIGASSRPIFE